MRPFGSAQTCFPAGWITAAYHSPLSRRTTTPPAENSRRIGPRLSSARAQAHGSLRGRRPRGHHALRGADAAPPRAGRGVRGLEGRSGLLVAAFAIGALSAALPSGVSASRLGPRTTVLGGLALMSVASLGFAIAGDPWILGIARFVQGPGARSRGRAPRPGSSPRRPAHSAGRCSARRSARQ